MYDLLKRNFSVRCDTQEESDAVLLMLEAYDALWVSCDNPTDLNYFHEDIAPIYYLYHLDKSTGIGVDIGFLSYQETCLSSDQEKEFPPISAEEFLNIMCANDYINPEIQIHGSFDLDDLL